MSADCKRVFLLRHGQVVPEWRARIYGSLDVPLSEEGESEARAIARLLEREPLGCVVSSGLGRTEYGAVCLREPRGLPRCDDAELRELDRGSWAGLDPDELERLTPGAWESWFRAPGSTRPPGGESLQDLLQRAWPRIQHWVRSSHAMSVAIVTHGWVIRVLLCHLLGIHLDQAARLDVRTADVHLLEWPDEAGERIRLGGFALDRVPGPRQLSE